MDHDKNHPVCETGADSLPETIGPANAPSAEEEKQTSVCLAFGFDAGNYANSYISEDLANAWRKTLADRTGTLTR